MKESNGQDIVLSLETYVEAAEKVAIETAERDRVETIERARGEAVREATVSQLES